MSNLQFTSLNIGHHFKIGNWLINEWHEDNKLSRFVGFIDFYNEIFVKELKESNVNNKLSTSILTFQNSYCNDRSKLNYEDKELLKEKIDEYLKAGILKQSTSQWSSPVYPNKVNRKLYIRADYSDLNSITKDNIYYLPSIKVVLDSICQSSLFSKIVIKDAIHQIALDEKSKPKTAFDTDFGKFEFNVMHADLKNARTYLQELMEAVLEGIDSNCFKVYLGHILVHTNNFDHHLFVLNKILSKLKSASLKIDVEESMFLMKEIVYIGSFLNSSGIAISDDKKNEIYKFRAPRSQIEVKEFLELICNYRDYLVNFDSVARPLYELIKTNCYFYWGDAQIDSIMAIKNGLFESTYIPFKVKSNY